MKIAVKGIRVVQEDEGLWDTTVMPRGLLKISLLMFWSKYFSVLQR